jgi:hypothetical protein
MCSAVEAVQKLCTLAWSVAVALYPMPDDVVARGGDDFYADAPRGGDAALAGLLTIVDS